MDLKTVSNVNPTGLHDMYTDFDRWMMAFNKMYRRRTPHSSIQTLAASSYDHSSCMDEQFMRPFAGNSTNRNIYSEVSPQLHDAEYFANYNNYILLRQCYDKRHQCFNDFRSKL